MSSYGCIYVPADGERLCQVFVPILYSKDGLWVNRCHSVSHGRRRWDREKGYMIVHSKTGVCVVEPIKQSKHAVAVCDALALSYPWEQMQAPEDLERVCSKPEFADVVRHLFEATSSHAVFEIKELKRLWKK